MIVCARCGQENPDGFRFCGRCASPLGAEAPRGEERKVVTVLFCDLVGFTARSDRADPEDVRATLRPYHARLRIEIERYGGTVEKFIGDAVMAVFGAPVAHEDDPERAVRAGLRITEAIEELNESQSGLDLSVRIGINSGEAVVALGARPAEGEGIVTGDVVNTAARLQTAAPVGAVVVGALTYRATREVFDYDDLDPVAAKGKQEPIPLWRALRAKSRLGVDIEQGTRAPLLGRDAELGLLKDTFIRTVRDQAPQLVTLTGEPGVGKSRLVWEFRRFVDDTPDLVYWRQGRCLPYGDGIAFWALGEIVKAQAGINETDDPERASAKLDAAVRFLAAPAEEAEWLKARLAPLVGGEGAGSGADAVARDESFAAWRRFLELAAARSPLVAVFEDLHWADPVLIEFLEHLVDWASGVPLLILCTGRPELYERHPGWGGGKRNSFTVALSPLGAEDTARLISELLSQAVLPAEVQSALVERSGGNPLYTEEFVKMLVDRGVLARGENRGPWRLAADADIAVPETLQALIAARLDTLPIEQKSLLQDGSVVGKVFWSGAVAAMGAVDEQAVRIALHELARKEFLRPARTTSMENQAEYSFWHVLIRDVAYGQIPRAARGKKHRAAARWIEGQAGDRAVDQADFLAYHYGQALELARAAGDRVESEGLREPLQRFLVLAGDRAFPLDAAKAESFYRDALELLPEGTVDRARVELKALDAGWTSGTRPAQEVIAGYEGPIRSFREAGDVEAAAEAMMALTGPLWVSGETERAERVAREVMELLGTDPSPLLARAHSILAGRLMLSSKFDECLRLTDRALELAAQFGMDEVTLRALQFRGSIWCLRGDPEGGLADLRQSLDMALSRASGQAYAAYVNLADFVWDEMGPAAGLAIYRAGIDHSKARGNFNSAMWATAESAWLLFGSGEWDECLRSADEVIEWGRGFGETQMTVIAMQSKADVLVSRGRAREAAELVAEFLPRARAARDPQILMPSLVTATAVDLALGRRPEATEQIMEYARDVLDPTFAAYFQPQVSRVLVQAGRTDDAQDYFEAGVASLVRMRHGGVAAAGILAEARGELEEAERLHADAAARWNDYGYPFEEAHSLLGQARCLIGSGRGGEAEAPLSRAQEILAGLGALPLLAEASRLLEEVRSAGSASPGR
ncbi:MAG: AAA family ATPase [Actinomycetota bacterium]|nr:AAA family ATPase [Actinomycetota bacterium]